MMVPEEVQDIPECCQPGIILQLYHLCVVPETPVGRVSCCSSSIPNLSTHYARGTPVLGLAVENSLL